MKLDAGLRSELKTSLDEIFDIDPNISMRELLDKYSINQVLQFMALNYGKEPKAKHLCKKFAKESLTIIY